MKIKEYDSVLQSVSLFKGIHTAELEVMLACIGAEIKGFCRGEAVLRAGDKPRQVGIVLAGQLHIVREDCDGKRLLLAVASPSEIFAETLCCADVPESPVTVMAETDATVMLLRFADIVKTCASLCSFHTKLQENMLSLIAGKNLMLQSRLDIVCQRSIREKVLRYLASFPYRRGAEICIPFNREELADFLCVERSALSHELSRMKKDGLIDYAKSRFFLQGEK